LAFEKMDGRGKTITYILKYLKHIEEYTSGEFYKRELPCILSLLGKNHFDNIEAIIVDGFVYLDDQNKLGLGGHLYERLPYKVPVIGVAKNKLCYHY
jgi:deoxyribonuclease V